MEYGDIMARDAKGEFSRLHEQLGKDDAEFLAQTTDKGGEEIVHVLMQHHETGKIRDEIEANPKAAMKKFEVNTPEDVLKAFQGDRINKVIAHHFFYAMKKGEMADAVDVAAKRAKAEGKSEREISIERGTANMLTGLSADKKYLTFINRLDSIERGKLISGTLIPKPKGAKPENRVIAKRRIRS